MLLRCGVMRRARFITVAFALAVALGLGVGLGGCVVGATGDLEIAVDVDAPDDGYTHLVVVEPVRAVSADDGGGPGAVFEPPVDDPCACTSNACLGDWVDAHLGCEVCVTLVCNGDRYVHVCADC